MTFHIGAETVDVDEILSIKRKFWKGRPIILMGDLIDAGLDRGMNFSNKINPEQQIEELKEVLQGLDVRSCLIGNHEKRIFTHTGINIYRLLGYPQLHELSIDGCSFYVTHGKGNAANPLTEFTKLFKFVDTDVIGMGHNHDLGKWTIWRGDKRVTLVRTGTFLNGAIYALQNAYPPKLKGWASVNTILRTVKCHALWSGEVIEI